MAGKVFVAILAVFLLLGAFRGSIADGIEGWRTDAQTQSFAVTTTAVAPADTTANVTITRDLFQDDVGKVTSITSNNTFDAPAASTYTAATNVILVSGLVANATHTLTVNYKADSENDVMEVLGPFLGFLIIGGLLVGIGYGVFKKRRGGG